MAARLWDGKQLAEIVAAANGLAPVYDVLVDDEIVTILHVSDGVQVLAALRKGGSDAWIVRYNESYFTPPTLKG